ncbi:hypothetical protein [Absidia glauca]|uniref:Uncharacterized protein n=1 Tax=Absidia glauca TaxID=4829 RepID=A0A163K304_ABSGL|nr:hypothetical protein [Absidia glauca]
MHLSVWVENFALSTCVSKKVVLGIVHAWLDLVQRMRRQTRPRIWNDTGTNHEWITMRRGERRNSLCWPVLGVSVLNVSGVERMDCPDIQELVDGSGVVDPDIKNLLLRYGGAFVEISGVGVVDSTHGVDLVDGGTPIKAKPYRLSWEEDKYLAKELKSMVDNGLIRPSGVWCSPIFFFGLLLHIDDLLGALAGSSNLPTTDAPACNVDGGT